MSDFDSRSGNRKGFVRDVMRRISTPPHETETGEHPDRPERPRDPRGGGRAHSSVVASRRADGTRTSEGAAAGPRAPRTGGGAVLRGRGRPRTPTL